MLSALLGSIQTTIAGSKGFLVTSFLPLALFFMGSGWMYSRLPGESLGTWTTWISQNPGFTGMLAALTMATLALGFSSWNTTLREILEGKPLRFVPSLEKVMMARQMRKMNAAQVKFSDSQQNYWHFRQAKWVQNLKAERLRPNTAAGVVKAPAPAAAPTGSQPAIQKIEEIESKINQYDIVSVVEMQAAYNLVLHELQQYVPAAGDWLDRLHLRFYRSIPMAEKRLQRVRLDTYWEWKKYADMPEATRLGNIGATIRTYAETRYQLSLDVFWPRLQRVIQSDAPLFETIQNAKIQLDLFVSVTWLTALFAVVWAPWLAFHGTDWLTYIVAWVVMPILAAASYHLAAVSYLAFAEVVSAAIDLRRFKLLEELHISAPAGLEEEKDLWMRLGNWIGYGSDKERFFFKK